MGQRIFNISAFTRDPQGGNPAGVCILSKPAEDAWMQKVARDMDLSETAFLHPDGDGFRLRWFTPKTEVDLCGHATLASAHILREKKIGGPDDTVRFYTKSGLLTTRPLGDWIEMDFPAESETPKEAPPDLIQALGVRAVYTGANRFDFLVEVESENFVREIQPDFELLRRVKTRGVIVTARAAEPKIDFVSRFFAPRAGIKEDPVTGSAHCCLGPFWGKRLKKEELTGFQVSKRGGTVKVRLGEKNRVFLLGQAVTISETEID